MIAASNSRFPHPSQANEEGLLAMGGDLSPETLLDAYSHGIFPWYAEGEPILWWSPNPRTILFPQNFHRSKRLQRRLKQVRYHAYRDKDFEAVISACAAPRREKDGTLGGTWILPEMMEAFSRLFVLGYAHSFEVYDGGELIGGLYGVCLNHVFYAESMFSKQRDGSKMAMSCLCDWAMDEDIKLIDCQMPTAHLLSLGAKNVGRDEFLSLIKVASV
ncbi:MAG TPA: leucyl/phenylalanyl-tRNA--protein transferase [Ghiorsea sp.]|nr:leucyl/phenylalanyl-tRNA--protein transferase [Ghiorsea sp.]HIP07921.1 leucyl/phenylalanyl-tRNA--protein transferase [Mariprofundaceae bacterium]